MFTEMPSWVPLEMAPIMDETYSEGPQLRDTPKEKLSTAEGKLPLFSEKESQKSYTVKQQSSSFPLPKHARAVLQPKIVVLQTPLQAGKTLEKVVSKPLPRLTTLTEKPAFKPLTKAILPQLPQTARVLPKPMMLPSTISHKQRTHTSETTKTDVKLPTPLSKRTIVDLGAAQHIHVDEKEQERRRQAHEWMTQKAERAGSKTRRYEHYRTENRPVLEPPRIGVFALYYVLTKLGIISDASSHWESKEDMRLNQEETDALHKKRLDEMRQAIEKEAATKRWGIATKVFSWMTSLMSIITGIALIVTGVGAVAGAMLLTAGVLTLSNQLLEVTGGWQKIAKALPGDDAERKRAIIMWMQIGITVLCLILAGAGVVFGGYALVGEATQNFMACFGGVVMLGHGVGHIGEGISHFLHKEHTAEGRKQSMRLAQLRHKREDLMEKNQHGIERMKQLFEALIKSLEYDADNFRVSQNLYRRG